MAKHNEILSSFKSTIPHFDFKDKEHKYFGTLDKVNYEDRFYKTLTYVNHNMIKCICHGQDQLENDDYHLTRSSSSYEDVMMQIITT